MNFASIRYRLPLSYVGLALLTVAVLGGVLTLTLQRSYSQQELNYLDNSGQLMRPGLSRFLESDYAAPSLDLYIRNLSFLIQARVQILDGNGQIMADSGSVQTQQFIYTNLSPSGMSADVFREGRAERYLYNVGINILQEIPTLDALGENATVLSQLPTENSLCGFGVGSGSSKTLQRTKHSVQLPLTASDGQHLGTLQLSEGQAFGSQIIKSVVQAWTYAGLVAVVVAVGAGWWISVRLVAPLSGLTRATEVMAAGDLSARVQIGTRDEFGTLGRSFNVMATRVQEMVDTLRSFVADAAHELHTPLTTLRVNLDLANEDQEHLDDYLLPAQNQVERLEGLVDSLLDLSRIEVSRSEPTRFSLSELVADIVDDYTGTAKESGTEFSFSIPAGDLATVGDPTQIRRAAENLLDNAFKFTPAGGTVTLSVHSERDGTRIVVSDSGIGIPTEDQDHLFRRFHRARNAVDYPGSGLGLAIVKAIVDRHKGRIEVESSPEGTRITIVLENLAHRRL